MEIKFNEGGDKKLVNILGYVFFRKFGGFDKSGLSGKTKW